jgi:multicomponent Na+:H+ antiporter subunit E
VSARVHRAVRQLPVLIWLTVIWSLLWGTWSWANLLSGLLVAVLATRLLKLPEVVQHARFRPWPLLVLAVTFAADLAMSSAQIAWETVKPRGGRRSALVCVQLRTDSDLLLTLVSEALTLVPGSVVLDVDRERRLLAVHLMPVRDRADVERRRAGVLVVEERVVRAFGSAADIARLGSPGGPDDEDDRSAAAGRGRRAR